MKQLASNAMELSGSRKLKWADEDGGVLHNIQYFDKDAEPSTVRAVVMMMVYAHLGRTSSRTHLASKYGGTFRSIDEAVVMTVCRCCGRCWRRMRGLRGRRAVARRRRAGRRS